LVAFLFKLSALWRDICTPKYAACSGIEPVQATHARHDKKRGYGISISTAHSLCKEVPFSVSRFLKSRRVLWLLVPSALKMRRHAHLLLAQRRAVKPRQRREGWCSRREHADTRRSRHTLRRSRE